MSTKHTPGPWMVMGNGLSRYVESRIRQGVLQEVAWCGATEDPGQMEANARLIAAAPEMLEALAQCIEALESTGYDFTLTIRDARSAIAKATGEEQ